MLSYMMQGNKDKDNPGLGSRAATPTQTPSSPSRGRNTAKIKTAHY